MERAEQTVSSARTRYLPILSLEAQAGQLLAPVKADFPRGAFGTLPGVGEIPAQDTTVRSSTDLTLSVSSSLSQPVTQIFKTRQSVRLARTDADAKREQLRAERASVAAGVKRVYYAILAGQTALAAAEEQVATQRELARNAEQLLVREAALEHAPAPLASSSIRSAPSSSRERSSSCRPPTPAGRRCS